MRRSFLFLVLLLKKETYKLFSIDSEGQEFKQERQESNLQLFNFAQTATIHLFHLS